MVTLYRPLFDIPSVWSKGFLLHKTVDRFGTYLWHGEGGGMGIVCHFHPFLVEFTWEKLWYVILLAWVQNLFSQECLSSPCFFYVSTLYSQNLLCQKHAILWQVLSERKNESVIFIECWLGFTCLAMHDAHRLLVCSLVSRPVGDEEKGPGNYWLRMRR